MSQPGLFDVPSRRVLVVVDDASLGELLLDALRDAGHLGRLVVGATAMRAALGEGSFDAAIVDLDTRARDGAKLVAALRAEAQSTMVIALLPCGGLSPTAARIPYHFAVEKPARLHALLTALGACPRIGE